jgi:CRP/FNR family cyclic AMP-dependent transcriptional regulator
MQVTSTYASFHYADLPLATYRADEVVLAAGSRTGRLLFLKEGAVAVVRQGTEIAIVDEPGAVFGEISALLDRPHTADVRALKPSQFYIADAALLGYSAAALFYVAGVLAQRLDRANGALVVSLRPQ